MKLREGRARPLCKEGPKISWGLAGLLQQRRASVDNRDEVFEVMAAEVVSMAAPTERFNLGAKEVWCG